MIAKAVEYNVSGTDAAGYAVERAEWKLTDAGMSRKSSPVSKHASLDEANAARGKLVAA
jgi:hypothetical protein